MYLQTQLIVNQSPMLHGQCRSRWTLATLWQVCQFLHLKSKSGLWNWLKRWHITYTRGRLYVHSPDIHYQSKLAYIQQTLANFNADTMVLLALDELTVYAKASISHNHLPQQPLAEQGILSNQSFRIAGCMNLLTGQVNYVIRNKISMGTLIAFYQQLVSIYPNKKIYMIEDNWTICHHPDVLAALEAQQSPFGFPLPKAWQELKPKKKYTKLNLPVVLLALPTYASWLNPIEKLWRKLKQELIHLHPFKDQMAQLKTHVNLWLRKYESSDNHQDLIRYVGIENPTNFWYQIMQNIPNVKERLFLES